ncbi:nuclear transport factor 2 family protein [Aquincola sp. S2]|uniref:Nuclear transport factor 2 family protein n=1 Tax=Pseudaquabacterium terrae TaxID=2732868 RepID=A0ABX2EG29_9BURK|nr:nuclear transport factor 2 family protein [Aquabacterium terrae]NRF67592.1 nuclear transport factor 2 family protein [Aquabacterium terrae]
MQTSEIADRLVALCRAGEFEQAQTELYADDAVSIEPEGAPAEVVEGLDAIREKGRQFMSAIETVHAITVSDPLVAGDYFSVTMTLDTTMKDRGRSVMEEICVYGVEDGKIVSEQFFYSMGE